MTGGWGWLAAPEARRLVLAAVLAVAAGHQAQRPVTIPGGSSLLGALTLRDFYGSEGRYRWTRERSTLVFPDPGPGGPVRVELDLAGWRPRGQEPPFVTLAAGGGGFSGRPSSRGETFSVDAVPRGWWSSDLSVQIESETYTPGPQDPRLLGVRFHGARLVPVGPALSLRRPPLRELVLTPLALLLYFGLMTVLGVPSPTAFRIGLGAAVGAGLAYAVARPYAALLSGPLVALMVFATVVTQLVPALARKLSEVLVEAARAFVRGLGVLGLRWALGFVLAGTAAVALAYASRPILDIDIGSGRETDLARGFGAFDSAAGATFRQAQRGAELDLGDFGGATTWTIAVTAAAGGAPRTVVLARAAGSTLEAALDARWATASFAAAAPFGWRSGLVIAFPSASDALKLGVDRVVVDRGRSLPSPRVVAAVVAAALLLGAGLGAAGLRRRGVLVAAAAILTLAAAALAADPVVVVPFVGTLVGIAATATALLVVAAGASAVAQREGGAGLPPAALASAGLGFVAWLSAAAFPLYRGGNFVFHSSIAEEIWKGRFLVYYLPNPESMLSRQAQWGDVVVPHPCLYQLLAAPLAALPRPWFYLAEKGLVSFWLASMVVLAALLARRVGGERAGTCAGVMMACLVPSFQLIGLGHLMTILGCWASSLALSFLVFRFERLPERTTWWAAVGLLTFCFLSYTAALLFSGLVLAGTLPLVARRDPPRARALLTATLMAGLAAFVLYYANWTWPFVSQTLPNILSGSSHPTASPGVPLWERLALQPHKLAYSYGFPAIPLAAIAGLLLVPRFADRLLLFGWGLVLVVVSAADLAFNFLLKHHYFVMVPVAVGSGLLLAKLAERGRWGALAALVLVALAAALGAETALAVALGRIP